MKRALLRTTWALGVAAAGWAAAPAGLSAAEGEPSLFAVNLGLSVWAIVLFLSLYFIVNRWAMPVILGGLNAREERIQGDLDQSAELRAEAEALLAEHKRQIADARRQAQELIAEGKAAGETLRKDIEEKAREEGQAMLERARREIAREKDAAVAELRGEAVDLALAAASKLLHEKIDADRDRELVIGYLSELGGSGGSTDRGASA